MTPILLSAFSRVRQFENSSFSLLSGAINLFDQDGQRMSEDETLLLLRTMMVIACEPGSVGAMSTGVSPSDPIFWVMHPIFEKGFHVLQLSPEYRDSFDFEWVNGTCRGSNLYDTLPFDGETLNVASWEG